MALEPCLDRLHVRHTSVKILASIDARGDIEGWPGTSRLCARDCRYFERTLATFARLGSLERTLHIATLSSKSFPEPRGERDTIGMDKSQSLIFLCYLEIRTISALAPVRPLPTLNRRQAARPNSRIAPGTRGRMQNSSFKCLPLR